MGKYRRFSLISSTALRKSRKFGVKAGWVMGNGKIYKKDFHTLVGKCPLRKWR